MGACLPPDLSCIIYIIGLTFVFALAPPSPPPNPLSSPACHTRHNVVLIQLQVINMHIQLRPSSIDYLTVEQFIPSKLPNKP